MVSLIRKWGFLVLVLVLSFFAWKPLLTQGFFTIHDNQQIVRLQQLDKSLASGQFPVRWVEDLGFGMGYPLFNFYPPLVYYLGEIFHLGLGLGFVDSIKLVWFVAIVGSGVTMYFLAREFFGKIGGIVSAVFYIYAPYHAIDAYIRGALAELFSFVWLPLILLFSYQKKFLLTAISLAGLMLTHNLIFLPFVGFYLLWSRNFRSLILAMGLTAFFWLPALAEKQFTLVDQLLIKNLASYQIHFICPEQLWYSPWGFGGSVAGCIDGLSFALGKIYFLVVAFGLGASLLKKSRVGLMSFGFLAFSLFMTLPYSRFIWEKISPLWYLQFPWRFLEFTVLFGALLVGSLNKKILAVLLIPLVIFINAKYFTPQVYLTNTNETEQTSDRQIKWVVSGTSFEYLPKNIATKILKNGAVWVDIEEKDIPKSKYEIINGFLRIKDTKFLPDSFSLKIESITSGIIRFNIVNFPSWKVWLDNKEAIIDDNNKYKLITVSVPVGEHVISGKFTDTPVRVIGNFLSITSILGILFVWKLKK